MQADVVLVVDDEPQIRRVVRNVLAADYGRVLEAATGQEAIDLAAAERPSLIVLDLGLPDVAGIDVCREIRGWSSAPIIVLSARHSDQEKVALLDAGADDYITKPFSPGELQARVRAQLRRARLAPAAGPAPVITIGLLVIDLVKPSVKKADALVHLTKTEWELLRTLIKHAGRTLTHQQLFRAVWGNSSGDMQQYLRVHIRAVRRKIEIDPVRPALIVTEPGVGYRFETDAVVPTGRS
jgi:two-component system KDP operon response regulator KdpE